MSRWYSYHIRESSFWLLRSHINCNATNLEETLELCKIMIEKGVDVNHKDRHGQVAFVYVLRLPQKEPDKLLPVYDYFLSLPNLVLTDRDRFNNTPIDFAEMDPRKKEIAERMKEYVSKQN